SADDRPGWIVNLTNDGWFGNSVGPQQHFQQARVRAIEEGLPLVRAANTGISAVVDPMGRLLRLLPLGAEGRLVSPVPGTVERTPYSHAGDVPIALVVAAILLIAGRRRMPGEVSE